MGKLKIKRRKKSLQKLSVKAVSCMLGCTLFFGNAATVVYAAGSFDPNTGVYKYTEEKQKSEKSSVQVRYERATAEVDGKQVPAVKYSFTMNPEHYPIGGRTAFGFVLPKAVKTPAQIVKKVFNQDGGETERKTYRTVAEWGAKQGSQKITGKDLKKEFGRNILTDDNTNSKAPVDEIFTDAFNKAIIKGFEEDAKELGKQISEVQGYNEMVAYRDGDANLYYDSWEDSSSSSYVFEVIAPLKNPEDKDANIQALGFISSHANGTRTEKYRQAGIKATLKQLEEKAVLSTVIDPIPNIRTEVDLKWKHVKLPKRTNDLGFEKSENGYTFIYKYDINDKTPFSTTDLLEELTATDKRNQQVYDGTDKKKKYKDDSEGVEWIYKREEDGKRLIDKNGAPRNILDIVNSTQKWGDQSIDLEDDPKVPVIVENSPITEENNNSAGSWNILQNGNVVEGTTEKHQIYLRPYEVSHASYNIDTATETNVINLFVVGVDNKAGKPGIEEKDNGSVVITLPEAEIDQDIEHVDITYTPEGGKEKKVRLTKQGAQWTGGEGDGFTVKGGVITIPKDKVKDASTVKVTVTDKAGNVSEEVTGNAGAGATLTDNNPVTVDLNGTLEDAAITDKIKKPIPGGGKATVKTKPATNKAGDAEAVVTVTYPDNTTDEITVPVKVVQPDQPDKERLSKKYPPKAKDEVIQVGETVELDEHNIANWDDISDYVDAVYDETEDKDEILTDRPGRYRNRGKLRILYTDGSEKILKITIKVEGEEETATPSEATPSEATPSEAKGNDAKKYDPIPQDVIVKPGETLEPEEGIKNKEELPSDTEYKDVTPSNVDKTKDYEAIIKVVYPDGSSEKIKVPVTVSKGSRGTGGSWSGGSGGGGSSSRILNTSNDRIYADPDMSVSSGSVGGSWILVDGASNKWSYHTSTGALAKKGWMYISNPYAKDEYGKFSWFKFNEDGIMEYGWIKSQNGKWYHTHAISDGNLGVLHRGWYYEPMDGKWYYLDQKTGAMCEGWLLIDNQYYYFTEAANVLQQTYLQKEDGHWYYDNHNRRPYGSMYQDERTPDNYYVDANGVWKPES